jgi:hypothetical protein
MTPTGNLPASYSSIDIAIRSVETQTKVHYMWI